MEQVGMNELVTLIVLLMTTGFGSTEVIYRAKTEQITINAIKSKEVIKDNIFRIYPHATINEFYLEKEYGRYTYEVTLLDDNGLSRKMVYDAITGSLLKNDYNR